LRTARILLSKAGGQIGPGIEQGVLMKSVHPMASVGRSKFKKRAKWKSVAAANIVQRYTELVRLRRQIQELEQDKGLLSTRALPDQRVIDCR
jgi:hypothetical protein